MWHRIVDFFDNVNGRSTMKINKVNPIAKAFAYLRKRTQVVPPKKGKGSYKRKEKNGQLRT